MLDDVFSIQEQVFRSIVTALKVELRSDEDQRLAHRHIDDVRAYACYLGARYELFNTTDGSLERSLGLIEKGLETVGDNDSLYALQGHVLFQMVNSMSTAPDPFEELLSEARRCARSALAINTDLALGHAVLGAVSTNTGNPQEAVRHYATALHLEPGSF